MKVVQKNFLTPCDIASLVVVRIVYGVTVFATVVGYFTFDIVSKYWIEPELFFHFQGFSWVKPWPAEFVYLHFLVMGLASLGIIFGAWYRVSSILVFLTFTTMFLWDRTHYLNHHYLLCLVALLFVMLPAERAFSIDCLRGRVKPASSMPLWVLWIVRFQIAVPYIGGGIAKLNYDWLHGEPMRTWLAKRGPHFFLGEYFTEEWVVYFFSHGGVLLDLFVVPALLWKRTRPYAYVAVMMFHLLNSWLFNIGVFPWFMLAASSIFFEPDWPRRFYVWLCARVGKRTLADREKTGGFTGPGSIWIYAFIFVFVTSQLLIPFRHIFYPGNVSWTEEGHNYSWHMKLRDKKSHVRFIVEHSETAKKWDVDPRKYLTQKQLRKMSTRPDMIRQFAHHLAKKWREQGVFPVTVRAQVKTSLNGRRLQYLVDPSVDLSREQSSVAAYSWIRPLTAPLSERR